MGAGASAAYRVRTNEAGDPSDHPPGTPTRAPRLRGSSARHGPTAAAKVPKQTTPSAATRASWFTSTWGGVRLVGPVGAMRRYLANRREAREARKMEAEMAAHEARERSAADEEERVRALLSGARGGCYPMTVAVEQSHGRVLSEMTRNTRRLDLDAMGVEPGETIVASRAEGAFGSLAPPDERDRYSREPRVYFVAAGRVDVLAPGPDPDDPEPGRKRWHLAHAVVPGGWFSGPMGELHDEVFFTRAGQTMTSRRRSLPRGVPDDHKAVCATPGTTLVACPLSVLERSGGLRAVDEARAELEAALVYVPAFQRLPDWQRRFVLDAFERETFTRGERVCVRGAACDAGRVVVEGAAEVTDGDSNAAGATIHLDRGAFFGDVALAVDVPREAKRHDATVVAVSRRLVVLALAWARIEPVAGCPGIRRGFSRAVEKRKRHAAERRLAAAAVRGDLTDRSQRSRGRSPKELPPEELGEAQDPFRGRMPDDVPGPLPWDPYAAPLGEPGGPVPTQMYPKGRVRKAKLAEALHRSLPFEGSDQRSVEKAVAEMREVRLRPGELLAEEGQTCWGICVLESGVLDLYHYDASSEALAADPGPETALHIARVGEGYVAGEICTLFNTVHDATMVAGPHGARLWGLSLFHYERAAGLRDQRGRRLNHAVFAPFETELTVFSSMEAIRLEHQMTAEERRRRGEPEVALAESHMERCLRGVPIAGTLLESIIRRAAPVHKLADLARTEENTALVATMRAVMAHRAAVEERQAEVREKAKKKAERDAEVERMREAGEVIEDEDGEEADDGG